MLFKNIAYIDGEGNYHNNHWIGTCGAIVAYSADCAPAEEEAAQYGEVYDGEGKLLLPAFYDAHAHAPMTLLRGYAENLPLQSWLNDMVFPFEAKITGDDCYWATLLACAEMARYGVVAFSDMYYFTDRCAEAVFEAGMKANLSDTLIAFGETRLADLPLQAHNEMLLREWHKAGDGRILIDANIHAEYTTNPKAIEDIVAYAHKHDLNIQVHVSETKTEHVECQERRGGLTPVAYLNSLGVFDGPCTAAHCVWVDDADIDILVDKGVYVAANPASNMKLGSGFAPYANMLERGVKLCLGTDGMASNNNHDMMQDMYLLALVGKGSTLDPAAVMPQEAFRAATRMGALSQGRADCGEIAVGMKADLCVLDITGPSWAPMINPLVNVVYSGHGSDVVLTLCDGQVVYRDGVWPTIDVEKAKAEVTAAYERIVHELEADAAEANK